MFRAILSPWLVVCLLLGIPAAPANETELSSESILEPVAEPAASGRAAEDLFIVPEGTDPKVIAGFLERIVLLPETDDTDVLLEHCSNANRALAELLQRDLDSKTFELAARLRYGRFLPLAEKYGDSTAAETRMRFLEQLARHPKRSMKTLAEKLTVYNAVEHFSSLTDAQQDKVTKEIARLIRIGDDTQASLLTPLRAAATIGGLLDRDRSRAIAAYKLFIAAAEKGDREIPRQRLARFEAAMRRLQLPGKPMDVSGVTLAGEPFKLEQFQGKVILIDFWATWCGPCRAELPHIKELYAAYHDQGFEVVGISQDKNLERLERFLAEEQIEWTNLCDLKHPQGEFHTSSYYGITGIPTAILINQKGVVCHLDARRDDLTEQLAKLLGPPKDAASVSAAGR